MGGGASRGGREPARGRGEERVGRAGPVEPALFQ